MVSHTAALVSVWLSTWPNSGSSMTILTRNQSTTVISSPATAAMSRTLSARLPNGRLSRRATSSASGDSTTTSIVTAST